MKTKKMNRSLATKNSDLKKTLSRVRGQLSKSEAKLGTANTRITRWKAKAAEAKTAVTQADARTANLQEEIDQLVSANTSPDASPEAASTEAATEIPDESAGAAAAAVVPDASWSLVQLRSEARNRGLTGTSNKRKADLLAVLTS